MSFIVYNEIKNGLIVDPISFEEIEIDNCLYLNGRYYSFDTIKQLLSSDIPKDPFTRQILSDKQIIDLEFSSSNVEDLNDIMNPK